MPRKKAVRRVIVSRSTDESWFKKQVTVGNMLSALVIVVSVSAVYGSTSATLTSQGTAIATIERKITEADKKDEKQQTSVVQERITLRAEMQSRAEKTAEGIAELNKQTAVLSTQLTTINGELVKNGQKLDTPLRK